MCAQTQFKLFDKIWGEPEGAALVYADQFPNSDFLLVGAYKTALTPGQYYVCRTDSGGNIIWNIDLGFEFDWDYITKVIKTKWNNYLIVGYSEGDSLPGFKDFAVWNIDSSGNVLFEKYFTSGYDNRPYDVTETFDSCFVITGVMNPPSSFNWSPSVLKIDRNGNEIWRKRIDSLTNYIPYDIEQLNDSSYIVTGQQRITYITFIAKYSPTGQLIWVKYPYGNSPNSAGSPIKTFANSDSAFSIFFGVNYTSTSGQVRTVLKVYDNAGTCGWTREYSERINRFSHDTRDSTVLAITNYKTISILNSDSSFTQVAHLSVEDSIACKSILYATPTFDGGYCGVGNADCGIYTRYFMVKFGPDGRYVPEEFGSTVTAFPNPSNGGTITLSFDMLTDEEVEINIFSVEGRIVYTNSIYAPANTHTELPIDLAAESIAGGAYIVEARTEGTVYRNKVLVLTER